MRPGSEGEAPSLLRQGASSGVEELFVPAAEVLTRDREREVVPLAPGCVAAAAPSAR